MSRTILIDAVDRTSIVRLDSFSFVEAANGGEVGIGGLRLDDAAASLSIPALKAVTADESAAGGVNTRLVSGFTQTRSTQRGPNAVAGQREWDVEIVDLNTLLDDYILTGSGAKRPAETDGTRVNWLLTTELNTVGGVTAGAVGDGGFTMDATDYRGRTPRDVLQECAEAAGFNFFVYLYSTSAGRKLFYASQNDVGNTSAIQISDVLADVTADPANTYPAGGPPTVRKDPDRVYSTVRLKYKRGTVSVTNATTLANFRRREVSITDLAVKSNTKATNKANAYLNGPASYEDTTIEGLSVRFTAADVNRLRPGQRVAIKLARHGISAFTYYRVIRRQVEPLRGNGGSSDVEYLVTFALSSALHPNGLGRAGSGGGHGGKQRASNEIWEEKSNATDDGASVVIDASGITVTNGAISVTNTGGTVVIDGTSDIWRIAATGTLTVPQNNVKGDVLKIADVNTGITGDPYTQWAIQVNDIFRQPLPEVLHNLSGQIINYYSGMARDLGGGITRVRALKGTTRPPLNSRVYKYWILEQQAF